MADSSEKKNSGAGKFFLGAVLGGLAGAIAGRFISAKAEGDDGGCNCEDDGCNCEDDGCETTKKSAEKK